MSVTTRFGTWSSSRGINDRQKSKSKSTESAEVVRSIGRKLKNHHVKTASVIAHCENLDKNGDYMVHINDLRDVFDYLLGRDSISQRALWILYEYIQPNDSREKGLVDYRKILEVFSDSLDNSPLTTNEHWNDDSDERAPQWATRRGSVGEWLQRAACPAEVANFRRFIACLEEYERLSGMKCVHKDDGFIIPMGPDLKASVSFCMGQK